MSTAGLDPAGLALAAALALAAGAVGAAEPRVDLAAIPANRWVVMKPADGGGASAGRAPGARAWQQLSWDPVARQIVLFGGSASTYLSDTWTYGVADNVWRLRRGHPDLEGPCRRDNHNLVYDPRERVHWLFNGIPYDDAQPGCNRGAIWTYDLPTNAWHRVAVHGVQSRRLAPGMAYDPEARAFVQFGGEFMNPTATTFVFDIDTRTWRQVSPPVSPPPRLNIENALVYDAAHKVFVLFGGSSGKVGLNDTWLYDPASRHWEAVSTTAAPPARDWHAMVYDPVSHAVILQGGRGGPQGTLGDTWVFRDRTWRRLDVGPMPMRNHTLVFDEADGLILATAGGEVGALRYRPGAEGGS